MFRALMLFSVQFISQIGFICIKVQLGSVVASIVCK